MGYTTSAVTPPERWMVTTQKGVEYTLRGAHTTYKPKMFTRLVPPHATNKKRRELSAVLTYSHEGYSLVKTGILAYTMRKGSKKELLEIRNTIAQPTPSQVQWATNHPELTLKIACIGIDPPAGVRKLTPTEINALRRVNPEWFKTAIDQPLLLLN